MRYTAEVRLILPHYSEFPHRRVILEDLTTTNWRSLGVCLTKEEAEKRLSDFLAQTEYQVVESFILEFEGVSFSERKFPEDGNNP